MLYDVGQIRFNPMMNRGNVTAIPVFSDFSSTAGTPLFGPDKVSFDREMPVEMPLAARALQQLRQGNFKPNIEPVEPVQAIPGSYTGSFTGDTTATEEKKPVNNPTYISALDNLEDQANFFLPWDDAQDLSVGMNQWGGDRDSGMRFLDQKQTERNFALESMMNRLDEVARKKTELKTQLEEKKAQEEAKKKELEAKNEEADNLDTSDNRQEIENRLKEVNYSITQTSGAIESKESKINELKAKIEENPEKRDELEAQISELEGEVSEKKTELESKQTQRRNLEEKKQAAGRKAEENRIKKEKAQSEKARLESEITRLQEEQDQLESSVDDVNARRTHVESHVEEKKAQLDRLDWIIKDFEFQTRS